MRIFIFSLGEKMNLNQETPRVDKKRSGLEEREWMYNTFRTGRLGEELVCAGEVERGTLGELVISQWHLQVCGVHWGIQSQLRPLLLETSYINVCTWGLGSQLSSSADMAASFWE